VQGERLGGLLCGCLGLRGRRGRRFEVTPPFRAPSRPAVASRVTAEWDSSGCPAPNHPSLLQAQPSHSSSHPQHHPACPCLPAAVCVRSLLISGFLHPAGCQVSRCNHGVCDCQWPQEATTCVCLSERGPSSSSIGQAVAIICSPLPPCPETTTGTTARMLAARTTVAPRRPASTPAVGADACTRQARPVLRARTRAYLEEKQAGAAGRTGGSSQASTNQLEGAASVC
jgi:hypothetical protein